MQEVGGVYKEVAQIIGKRLRDYYCKESIEKSEGFLTVALHKLHTCCMHERRT